MKGILIWVALVLAVSTAWGYDQPDNLGGQKITPIKGMIIVCSGQANTEECNEVLLNIFINKSPIKILTRQHLKTIFEEKSLQMSGLTEREKSEELGKILGASHILLYKTISEKWGSGSDYTLINIHSSEIEYAVRTIDFLSKKNKIKTFSIADFFEILNQHVAK